MESVSLTSPSFIKFWTGVIFVPYHYLSAIGIVEASFLFDFIYIDITPISSLGLFGLHVRDAHISGDSPSSRRCSLLVQHAVSM